MPSPPKFMLWFQSSFFVFHFQVEVFGMVVLYATYHCQISNVMHWFQNSCLVFSVPVDWLCFCHSSFTFIRSLEIRLKVFQSVWMTISVMYTTEAVVKIKPEKKKIQAWTGIQPIPNSTFFVRCFTLMRQRMFGVHGILTVIAVPMEIIFF